MQATAIYEQKELQPDRKPQRKVAEKNQQIQKHVRKILLENHLIMNSSQGCKQKSVLARRVLYSSTKKEKSHDANE
jgi:hypothetical protein